MTFSMQAVILAAGRGTRLNCDNLPKTLTSVGGKPMIDRILDGLQNRVGVSPVIVGGYAFDVLKAHLAQIGFSGKFIYNERFEAGNLLTLLAARSVMRAPFVVMNADHVFSGPILDEIFQEHESIRIVCDTDRPLTDDDMKVDLEGPALKMSKTLEKHQAGYIGSTIVPKSAEQAYWKAAERVLGLKGERVCVEEVVNELAAAGQKIQPLIVNGHPWFEVDNMEDLKKAEEMVDNHAFQKIAP